MSLSEPTLHAAGRDETVRRIARDGDPDRALAALFAPGAARGDLVTLIAFNVELARIAEQTSEPDLGAIRLQWWRDAIDEGAQGAITGHPVADAVTALMVRRDLSGARLGAMIDARAFDLATKIMPDQAALETYLQDTAGALFALSAECLGAQGTSVELAAAQGGLAYGLTGLMRALPVHAAHGRVDLPADMLRSQGSSPEEILAGKASEGVSVVLAELRRKAREALEEARQHVAALDPGGRAAFLPLALV
ncbi:MAG TPA: squalene/phytoene synthase family protein, partial [Methyloceanibacter sp.]|nr:squalene/phytoene synthase family protein [Methyloceanibacter sp.]